MYDELVKQLREDVPTALANCDFDFVEGWSKEAADAVEELSNTKWVPVTERLPEDGVAVYACVFWPREGDNTLMLAEKHGEKWKVYNFTEGEGIKNYVVTYWMPLPDPPRE